MGTSASLHIRHSGESASFLQHYDGYPTHVMKTLAHWVKTGGANKLDGIDHNGRALNSAHHCGYSRALRQEEGSNLDLIKVANPEPEIRGGAWSYLIDLDAKTIKVYKNDEDEEDSTGFEIETTDPRKYVEILKPEYMESELKAINENIEILIEAGFTIN